MSGLEADDKKSPEVQAKYFQEDIRGYLKELHKVGNEKGEIAFIDLGGYGINEFICGNVLHHYWRMSRTFVLEVSISQTAFQKLKKTFPEKPDTFPKIRSEVMKDCERYIVRITPPGDVNEQSSQADETTLQFDIHWGVEGFLVKEVPHPDLPERLKREFAQLVLAPEEVLDISVLPFNPKRKTNNTFKTTKELLEEQLAETEVLARGFDFLAGLNPSAKILVDEVFNRGLEYTDEDLGKDPSEEEMGMDEETYWYFYSKYGEDGETTDPVDQRLIQKQWENTMRKIRINMRRVSRLRKAKDN